MKWLSKLVYKLSVKGRELSREEVRADESPIAAGSDSRFVSPKLRLGFVDAMNGRIIEIATAVPSSHHVGHSDWRVELFIVPEDQNISEAVAMLMLLKGEK